MKKPLSFGWAVLVSILLNVLTLGATVGTFLIFYYILSLLDKGEVPAIVGIIAGTLLVLYVVVMNGLKGALIKSLLGLTGKEPLGVREFFGYALRRGPVFFVITLLKLIITGIAVAPIYLLYNYVLLPMAIPYMDLIVGMIMATIIFVIEFPFMYTYIAAACEETGTIGALKGALRLLRKKHISAFGMYFVYAIVWVSLFVPLMDIITVFVFYPIIYASAILFYERYK